MARNTISIGSDPEMMLKDREGRLVSAIGKVKGTKEAKQKLGNDHYMFYDNVLVEMNVKPSFSEEEMIANFADCFTRAAKFLHPYTMNCQASGMFPPKECQHPDSQVFGCEPEYCAYDLCQVIAPTCENTFRSAGGHIHLGTSEEMYPLLAPVKKDDRTQRDYGRVWVVRMMDLFVGLPSILIDHDPTSAARRKLYGKAGTHRPKEEYGVEYRATSNFWLSSPKMASLVYKLAMHTVDFVANGGHKKLWKIDEGDESQSTCTAYSVDELRKTIDNSDKGSAKKLLEKIVKPNLPSSLWASIFTTADQTIVANFYREWKI